MASFECNELQNSKIRQAKYRESSKDSLIKAKIITKRKFVPSYSWMSYRLQEPYKMELQITNIDKELENKQKQFVSSFMLSTIIIHLFFGTLFYFVDLSIVTVINVLFIGGTIVFYFITSKRKFDFDFLINAGLYSYTFLMYLLVLIFWETFPTAYLWFVVIPITVLMVKPFISVAYWTLGIIVLSLSAPVVSPVLSNLLNVVITISFSDEVTLLVNSSVFIAAIFMLLFMLYFYSSFSTLKVKRLKKEHSIDKEASIISHDLNKRNEEKFNTIYLEIEKYVRRSKPYRQSNYNIDNLASDLNTNTNYIAKALKHGNGLSFNNYINEFRIAEVKKRLIKHDHEQFTLKHIYSQAGFTHQSTFNRVFKVVEGLTPSEFIERLK